MLIRSTSTRRPTCELAVRARSRGFAARAATRGLAVVGAAVAAALLVPALAAATPTVTAKARILPIPGFPHTGNCLGCGADLEGQVTISGTEYAGGPPPITKFTIYFPKGSKITTSGFPTCSATAVERSGVGACKRSSRAGSGSAEGYVSLGGERVEETVSLSLFFVPGGVDTWIEGNTPTKIEKLAKGHWSFPASGPVITSEVPLIETLPGAPDSSAKHVTFKSGGAIKKGRRTIYYGTVPRTCPAGGFRGKAVLEFLGGTTVPVETKLPCPPGSSRHHH